MDIIWIIFIVIGVLTAGGLIFMLAYTLPIAGRVYREQLVRTSPEKWGRSCSCPENGEQLAMWNAGVEWADTNKSVKTDLHTVQDGYDLYGEYYDFGSDRCVLILPGRCESLMYSYYFAPPYQRAGFNVLVVDTRCHGKSDGEHSSIGVKESDDVIAWIKLLERQFGIKEVYLHCICIGTSAGLFAITRDRCPDTVKGLVTEGCFVSFRETFKRHMMAEKRPIFPVLDLVMLLINKHTGINIYRDTPMAAIKRIKPSVRVLFLYGEQDIFSIPPKSRKLFAACAATDKKLVWFDRGGHSHLRINNVEKYDNTVIEFVSKGM